MIGFAQILGLLGLLSIIALIIIYLIKPNYQQKFISSTYVWKQSLKYRKKQVPINKLRNILLIICQVLILVLSSIALAQPIIQANEQDKGNEVIVIIEDSANMLASDGETSKINDSYSFGVAHSRFYRAVVKAMDEVIDTLSASGRATVILAGKKADVYSYPKFDKDGNVAEYIPIQRLSGNAELANVRPALENLAMESSTNRWYGTGDVTGALQIASSILKENPECRIILYTATNYTNVSDAVEVVNLRDEELTDEAATGAVKVWNVAILNGSAYLNEQYVYSFSVDVAAYGKDTEVELTFNVNGANQTLKNGEEVTTNYRYVKGGEGSDRILIPKDQTVTITVDTMVDVAQIISTSSDGNKEDVNPNSINYILNYESVNVQITKLDGMSTTSQVGADGNSTEKGNIDSLSDDNSYWFYGGRKNPMNVVYASGLPNPFVNAIVASWRSAFTNTWNINPIEVPQREHNYTEFLNKNPGDIYIFEHIMPDTLPSNGVIILLDPLPSSTVNMEVVAADGSITDRFLFSTLDVREATAESDEEDPVPFTFGIAQPHPIISRIMPNDIEVMKYTRIEPGYDDEFTTVLYCEGDPVMLVKNTDSAKILIFSLDVNYSTMPLTTDFARLFYDIFMYFFPKAIDSNVYEVGDSISLDVSAWDTKFFYETVADTEFNGEKDLDNIGSYTIERQLLNRSKEPLKDKFFVKIPAFESDINRAIDDPVVIYAEQNNDFIDTQLLIYFAAALVALLFAEWWLQSRDQF